TGSARQYSFARGGALGWGMPAAVGFSLGIDRAPVVSIVGDGAALYSPQALWTAAHERLPVTFVVINNREYNILKRFMRSQPHYASTRANRFIGMDILDPAIDFLALAASMGLPAHTQCALNDPRVDAKRGRRGFDACHVGHSQRLAALPRCSTVCAHAAPNKLGEAAAPIPKNKPITC